MKNNVLTVSLLTLLIGLFVGYTLAPRTIINPDEMSEMHEEMEKMMGSHNDSEISADGTMGHAMDDMMLGLRGKTGEAYEKAFLEGMIVHHIGAIDMAEELLEQTDRPELVKMANDIISVQSQEVEMMEQWLSDWFNL